mmetsp:Transcript_28752/g.73822  ORF Transcript_28752/g.73822 Transcript_28752/m.73822 type:complete len:111 (-) Transcript_28752:1643-1975(-)
MAHEWGFAAGDGNDEGAFAWFPNAEDLEGEEEEALARQLADFEGAVHGEIHLHNKKAPHGKGSSASPPCAAPGSSPHHQPQPWSHPSAALCRAFGHMPQVSPPPPCRPPQ